MITLPPLQKPPIFSLQLYRDAPFEPSIGLQFTFSDYSTPCTLKGPSYIRFLMLIPQYGSLLLSMGEVKLIILAPIMAVK